MNISKEDHKVLKDFLWWTADKKTPYIVKGGIKDSNYYILVSDLKNCWYRKADKETILEEKQTFNKALQVANFEGILEILAKPISSFDKQADYTFEVLSNGKALTFELQTVMNVYPFRWQFFLNKVSDEFTSELLQEDLISPLLSTLKAMEMRVNLLKKHFLDLEAEHMKKLNDREKTLYKSKLEDSEDYWKYLVHDMPIDYKLQDFDLSDAGNYFFKTYSKMKMRKIEEMEERQERERREREARDARKRKADELTNANANSIATAYADEYVENADEINKKIALEKKLKEKEEKKNKKTKLSFL